VPTPTNTAQPTQTTPAGGDGETTTTEGASAGDKEIEVASTAGFDVLDLIVINPGGANEEMNQVAGFGSLLLMRPLQFNHAAGEAIEVVEAPQTTLTERARAHSNQIKLESTEGFGVGDFIFINPGDKNEDSVRIASIHGNRIRLRDRLENSHKAGEVVIKTAPPLPPCLTIKEKFELLIGIGTRWGVEIGDSRYVGEFDINGNGVIGEWDFLFVLQTPICKIKKPNHG
jgi:hypothetical protein